jgi:hypothetical protein
MGQTTGAIGQMSAVLPLPLEIYIPDALRYMKYNKRIMEIFTKVNEYT